MQEQPERDPFQEGREDPAEALRERLASAPLRYAQGALENPALDDELVEVMLHNDALLPETLERISLDDRFRRSDTVKRALVFHRQTPSHVSMQLVKFVAWRDLMAILQETGMPLPLRSLAEQTLGERVNQIPINEQVGLARGAGRAMVQALVRSRNPRVIQELMLNPRLVETDVLSLARDPNVPGETLGTIARHTNWNRRPGVRRALVENISTPIQDAVRMVSALSTPELRELARNVRVRPPVRNEAERTLRTRKG